MIMSMSCCVRSITVTCATAISIACARTGHVPSAVPSGDRSFVAAITEHVRESTGMRVDVDPQPLPESLEGPGAALSRAPFEADSPYAYFRALDRAAIRAAPRQQREHCAGILVFDDARGAKHSGCPKSQYVLLVVGTPRRDSAEILKMLSSGQSALDSHRWVRVLETQFTPQGSVLAVVDYVIGPSRGAWRVLRRKSVLYLE